MRSLMMPAQRGLKRISRVLITGGNGLIGSHLAEKLEDGGDSVTLLDLKFNSNTQSLNCEKLHGDIRDYPTVRKAVDGKDAVFHFGAVSRVTKLSAERACLSYSDESNIARPVNCVIMRFSNVYGSERDLPERVVPKFMNKALRGEDLALYGGEQILDFTFIDDTVSGIMKAYSASLKSDAGIFGEAFHFVTGRGVSVSELARMIIDIVGSGSKIIHEPSNSFEVRKFIGDPSKAEKILGYKPTVNLEHGLRVLMDRMVPTIVAR